jgi:glycosyltransferase involved in cell wall biosynthesis
MILHARVVAGSGGGPDKTILRSARYVDGSRFRVAAAYIHPHDDPGMEVIRDAAKRHGCPLWEIGESGALDPRTLRSLLQLCGKLNVAVWHAHDYKSNVLGLLLRRFWPMKLVTTVHGWTRETARTRLYYHVDNLCLKRYDEVMAVSPLLVEHCKEQGVKPERLTYVPNGIEPADYARKRDARAARQSLGVDPRAFVIGVVGRLSAEKGVDRAVHTLAALRPRYPHVQLHLIGDGTERGKIESLGRELGVAGAVRFWGWQADAKPYYEMMDALLLPSYTEGLPNVVLEAMAMGVPVAATSVGGVPELLDEGRCGVVLSQDQTTWADGVAPLIVSADRRAEYARRSRERIAEHYAFDKRMEREVAVYDRLLSIPARDAARRAA